MNWFKNLKTLPKLMLSFGLFCGLMGLVGYQGMTGMSKINGMLEQTYKREMAGVAAAKDIVNSVTLLGRIARQTVIDTEDEALRRDNDDYKAAVTELNQRLELADRLFYIAEGKALLADAKKAALDYSAVIDEVVKLGLANKAEAAAQTLKRVRPLGEQAKTTASKAEAFKQKKAAEFFEESQTTYKQTTNLVLSIIGISVIFAIGLGYFIAQMIARPLTAMVNTATELAQGRLDQNVDYQSGDEAGILANAFRAMIKEFSSAVNETAEVLGCIAQRDLTARMTGNAPGDFQRIKQSLNAAADNLEEAIEAVQTSSDQVAATAGQLSTASQQIATGAQEQAASLEETSATLEEITSTVKQNADNAKQANQLANGAKEAAEKGGTVMGSAVGAMNEINSASTRIAEIISTIDEIAFQTNLLALNAAVEAARAGEQGRGFAVVAAEVRNLAQRSATAAKEIKGLIQDSVTKVGNGSQLVHNSGLTLEDIVARVKRVTDIVGEIAAASQEQATGVEQVAKAMAQMDQVTQANSGHTEEMSSTAEELSSTAANLQQLVSRFVIKSSGGTSFSHAQHKPALKSKPIASMKKPLRSSSNGHHEPALVSLASHTGFSENGFEEF